MENSVPNVLNVLNSMNSAIQRAIALGVALQALEISQRALELTERSLGKHSPTYAVQLQIRASVLTKFDQRDEAAECLHQALQLRIDALGPEHPAVATVLYNLALLRASERHIDEAVQLLQQSLNIRKEKLGADHELTVATRRAIESYQSWENNEQPDWPAVDLHNKGLELVKQGRFREAESYLLASIEKNLFIKGAAHPDVALCQKTLGDMYVELGDFNRAKPVLEQALDICVRSEANTSELKGMIFGILARVHTAGGDFDKARRFHEDAIREFELLEGPPAMLLSTALCNFAKFEHDLGDNEKAEGHFTQALSLVEPLSDVKFESHRAKVLNGLAIIAQDQGDMTKAIRLMETSVQLKKNTLGETDLSYAHGADNLAAMYGTINETEKAKEWNLVALRAFELSDASQHPGYLKALLTSGIIAETSGDSIHARETYQRVVEIASASGINDDTVARALTKLATLETTGNNNSKIRALEQIVKAERSAVGTSHPRYARAIANLATAQLDENAIEPRANALAMLREACNILQHNEIPVMQVLNLHRLIDEEWRAGATNDVQYRLQELVANEDKMLSERLFVHGGFDEAFGNLLTSTMSLYISAYLDVNDSRISLEEVVNCMLTRKGHLFESAIADRRRIVESEYPSVRDAAAKVAEEQWRIVETVMEGPVRRLETLEDNVKKATERCAELTDRAVSSLSLESVELRAIASEYVSAVNQLQATEVLLDIVRFDRRPPASSPGEGEGYYIAFVSIASRGVCSCKVLGRADDIEEMIRQSLDAIGSKLGSDLMPSLKGSKLFLQLADDVSELISVTAIECKRLFIAPDGVFWRFPFELLPWTDDNFIIDSLEVVYLTSVRDLVGQEGVLFESTRPTVVCDPNFDLAGDDSSDDHWGHIDPLDVAELERNPLAGMTIRFSQVPEDAVDLGFDRLPGSEAEGKEIAALVNATMLIQDEATKGAVRVLCSPQILHIATHCFALESESELHSFWSDRLNAGRIRRFDASMQMLRFSSGRMSDYLNRLNVLEGEEDNDTNQSWPHLSRAFGDPLIRCGLVLAGANAWLNNEATLENAGNGILTAREIAHMDLRGTELVVLSGCSTGASSATTERGVEGLRRGFLLAGAKCVVVTQWEIPDRETRDLMTVFYQRVCSGEPKATALRNAKLWMKKQHPEPYYWAGFVIHGDSGPLVIREEYP